MITNIKNLLIALFVVMAQLIFAQADTVVDINASYQNARQLAFSGQRAEARALAQSIINVKPNFHDAYILIARTLAWDKQYPEAKKNANVVLGKKPGYSDAIDLLIDIYYWQGDSDSALIYCNLGLSYNPNSENFLYKKAVMLKKLGNDELTKYTLEQLLTINPAHEKGNEMLDSYKWKKIRKVKVGHYFNFFEEPWIRRFHITSAEISSKPKFGSLLFRTNLGQLTKDDTPFFSDIRPQFEVDAYPKLGKKQYAYVSYGYAPNGFFAKHRAGLEIFRKLKYSFEASLGMRYLYWSDDLFFYTASVGKYYKNYWFSARTFLTPKSNGVSHSFTLSGRKYFATAEDYIGINIGMGRSPDDPSKNIANIEETVPYLQGKKISVVYKERLGRWVLESTLGFELEEYRNNIHRNVYSAKVSLSYYL